MLLYTIAIDAMGGDHAPGITVNGSLAALRAFDNLRILLVGQVERIEPLLQDAGDVQNRITCVNAREVIENTESPVFGIRRKTDSSLVRALGFVREGQAQALVSAGSTGAIMAGGMFRLGRIEGIDRPAIATLLPTLQTPALLIDSGANVDCQPEWLVQFANMGHVYMKQVMGVKAPRVALLNIGEEAEKGNQQTLRAHELLAAQTRFQFIGNLEARGIPMGGADVIVSDGFVGNTLLKTMEGIITAMFSMLKAELMSSKQSKLGALLSKKAFGNLKKKLDADEVGGVPLLGVSGAVIKAHGNSSERAFFCAIQQAVRMLDGNVVQNIRQNINQQ